MRQVTAVRYLHSRKYQHRKDVVNVKKDENFKLLTFDKLIIFS